MSLAKPFLPPMLATPADRLPAKPEGWVLEPKLDGYRCIAAVRGGAVDLRSRNGVDFAETFPGVARAVAELALDDAVLDGEIVARDASGTPRFELIQNASPDAVLVVFDLLRLDGEDLRGLALDERRARLERALQKKVKRVELVERLAPDDAIETARKQGHEGVVAKRRSSTYVSKRSDAWIKVKVMQSGEFAVVGITPSTSSAAELGALGLATFDGGRFVYAGRVGTGFTAAQRKQFMRELKALAVDRPPVDPAPADPDMIWIEPKLVAQVRFLEWTADGNVRHPSFSGFRVDKSPEDCAREDARSTGRPMKNASAKEEIRLTNPDRLLWPRDGITKKDLAAYYEAASAPVIAALEGRPLALEHWNDGIDKPSWFQQDIAANLVKPWMTIVDTPARTTGKDVRHFTVDGPTALRWLAQHSVLTIHTWAARAGSLDSPDWVLFDFDPAKGKGIGQTIEPALVLRDFLENLGLPSVPKTSGKRGLHVLVPLEPGHGWDEVAAFAETVGNLIASRLDDVTTERTVSKRKGRLYLDCMQNAYGKLVVAPYSPRGIDGAPVSAPLKWEDVTPKLDPLKFTVKTMPRRIDKLGDLFAAGMKRRGTLPKVG
jgi:bifunctional non-homologous end joining protein LigD